MNLLRQLQRSLTKNPKDVEIHNKLAYEYKRLNYFQQAIKHFKEALRIQFNPSVQFSLGCLYLDLKRYPEASRSFTQILKITPQSADACNGLGEAQIGMKSYQEAIASLKQAIELQPEVARFHYNLGRAYQKLNQYTLALAAFQEAIRKDPGHYQASFYLGFAYCQVGQYKDSIKAFRQSLKSKPDSAETYCNLGYAYATTNNLDQAVKAYQQALHLNPQLTDARNQLHDIQSKVGRTTVNASVTAGTVSASKPAVGSPRRLETQPANGKRSDVRREEFKGLAKVAGMADLKKLLFEEVIQPMRNPELYRRFRLSLPNGLLLYGPPGCGKTYIAMQLADELKWNFIEVRASSIGSVYIHGTALAIRDLFKEAETKAPSLLFIDEFEGLVPRRGDLSGQQQHKAEEVNEFLLHLNECAQKKIFVIAATNEPQKIDEAIRRPGRLDKIIYVGAPDLEARKQALQMYLENRPLEKLNLDRIAKLLKGYPFSDISHIVDESARLALREGMLFISQAHVEQAIRQNPSSLTPSMLSRYRSFQQRGVI